MMMMEGKKKMTTHIIIIGLDGLKKMKKNYSTHIYMLCVTGIL